MDVVGTKAVPEAANLLAGPQVPEAHGACVAGGGKPQCH
jgi:hypothetical protein